MNQKLIGYFVGYALLFTFSMMFHAIYRETAKGASYGLGFLVEGFLAATFLTILLYFTIKRRTDPTTLKYDVPDSKSFLKEVTELMLEEGFVPIHTLDQTHYFIKQGFFDSETSQVSQPDEGEFKIKGPNYLIAKLNKNLAFYQSLELSRLFAAQNATSDANL